MNRSLNTLEVLIKQHEWDDICAKHNDGLLTLFGWDSHAPDLVRRPLPTPLDVSVMDHPKGTGVALCIGIEVIEGEDGNIKCEPRFYWGVLVKRREVEQAWGPPARGMGAPKHASAPAEQAMRALYPPNGIPPESVSDVMLCRLVNDKLRTMGSDRKTVSTFTVGKVRKRLAIYKSR
jgi:hypothetical protein